MVGRNHPNGWPLPNQGSQATHQSRSLSPETLSKETQTSLQATE